MPTEACMSTEVTDAEAGVVPYGVAATSVLEKTGQDTRWIATADAERHRTPDLMLSDKMPTLVKGAGYARVGGNMPLNDDEQIFRKSMKAEDSFRAAIRKGISDPESVVKGLSPEFAGQFAGFMSASPQNQGMQALVAQLNKVLSSELGKSITLSSPLSSGFVPFDLVAPSSLD